MPVTEAAPERSSGAAAAQAAPAPAGPSAELVGVTKRFGAMTAVDGIDLVVGDGEFLSLLGPSGCGKTTSLRLLAGFEVPDAGNVRIGGRDVADMPAHRRPVNTVFQHYALFPHLTVAENVAFGLRMAGVGKAETTTRVGEALDMVHLQPLAKRKPKQLSGGQQQRVALARALVNRPQLLLLDEPLGALDRKLRQEMQIELKLLQTQVGITFVYVTHDQEEALSMSDRIAVLLDGHIEQLDNPDVMYDRPATAFVAAFLGQQNFLPGTSSQAGRTVEVPGAVLHSERVAEGAEAGAVLAAVRPEFIELHTAQPPPSTQNCVDGTLVSVSHLGDVLQYVVTTAACEEMLVRRPRASAQRLVPGERVWCSWPASSVHVFPMTQAKLVLADSAA